jgi:peptide/nickel transport system substrate-binding protein
LGLGFTFSTLLAVGGTGTSVPGTSEMEQLVNVGLTTFDTSSRRVARIAEEAPTVENGGWRVLPDGRMEMTYRLGPNVLWHDGTPLTADDFLFTASIGQDRELPIVRPQIYDFVERIEARDPHTLVVHWKQPYIEADQIFGASGTQPIPKHLLSDAAQNNKPGFTGLSYWSHEFVGVGPYRVKEWADGSHAIVEVNDRYFLGRPRIDEVEIRFIPAPTTMLANIMAGVVDLTMGRGLSLEQGQELQRQWRDGRIDGAPNANPLSLRPQHLNPDPPILADVQFRRALYHAINRQELVDTLMSGFSVVAHHPIPPGDLLQEAGARATRYEYDPRRAVQMLEGMGLTRGPDGFFRDGTGQRIQVELRRAGDDEMETNTILTTADFWSKSGIAAEPVSVPPARQRDLEYRAKFPGFEISGSGAGLGDLRYLRYSELRIAEHNWNGRNRTGYTNPELDVLTDRYVTTIPINERTQVLGQILQHLTERVIIMYLFFEQTPTPIANRLMNVTATNREAHVTWNAHEWDVK